jgi:two-component system LytT family response regulator
VTHRAVVADDEALGRRGVVSRLAREKAVAVVAECRNGREAIDAVLQLRPDLLFLDVQMPGIDGFGVVRALPEASRPHVIFVTAYDQHAVQAFELHALDYLLKPIDDARFSEALRRAFEVIRQKNDSDVARRMGALLAELDGGPAPRASGRSGDRFVVRDRGKLSFVRHADVDWIEAAGDYVRLHAAAATWMLRGTMSAVERDLPSKRFLRIHRSTIVNVDRIREIKSLDNGDHIVRLQDSTELRLSRTYGDALARLIG